MYTLESDKKEKEIEYIFNSAVKRLSIWLLASGLCFVFYLVYSLFSHGVRSAYMTYLFAWPLVFGALPNLTDVVMIKIMGRRAVNIFWFASSDIYCFGVAALTVGSLLRGIFEIAGTSSVYQQRLMTAGWCMLAAGAAGSAVKRFWQKRKGSY